MGLRLSVDTAWGVVFAFCALLKAISRLGGISWDNFYQLTAHFYLVRLGAAVTSGPILAPALFV